MKSNQRRSLFDGVAQSGLWIVLITSSLIILKPFFPDQWVTVFANWIHSDFDTLAELAVQLLSISGCIGLACCLGSLLVNES